MLAGQWEVYGRDQQMVVAALRSHVEDVVGDHVRHEVLSASGPAMQGEDEGLRRLLGLQVSLQRLQHRALHQMLAVKTRLKFQRHPCKTLNASRCIDISRYFSRDTYRDIIFYNHNFFFFPHNDFDLGKKET